MSSIHPGNAPSRAAAVRPPSGGFPRPPAFSSISDPAKSGWLFLGLLVSAYCVVPYWMFERGGGRMPLQLAAITAAGCAALWAGWSVRPIERVTKWRVRAELLVAAVWLPFVVFSVYSLMSAERIPILVALGGGDSASIAYFREKFLKARDGWQSSFVYINALLTGALIPYTVSMLFLRKNRFRWWFFAYFFLYCVSFMEKTYFFKAALPMLYLVLQQRIRTMLKPSHWLILISCCVLLMTSISGGHERVLLGSSDFFSASYVPTGSLDHVLWRAVAIPIVTAVDSLTIFQNEYAGRFFSGATSSILAGMLGMSVVPFEKMVFAIQWGQNLTATGSANAVYLVESYVNWGYPGVVVISFAIGVLLRFFAVTPDEALKSLWILFCFQLFVAGFIGLMFSNGFLLVFLIAMLFRIDSGRGEVAFPARSLEHAP